MSSKTCLITFGLIVLLAVLASAENEEQSLAEELSSMRVVRDAEAGRRKQIKKSKNKNRKRNNKESRIQGRMVDGKCIETATTVMRRWKDQVANFLKQKSRIEKQSSIAEKKAGKKDVFAPIAQKLIDVGGGNKSALTCSGSADSDGAKQLANLTMTILECEMEINATCNPDNFPKPNMTIVDNCTTTIENFEMEAKKCYGLSKEDTASEACTCWTSEDMMMYSEEAKSCKITEVGDIAKGLKACKDAFSKCRKYEDEVISTIQTCSQTADELQAKIDALSNNKDALIDVKAKIATATARRRHARAPATDCAGFLSLVMESKLHIFNADLCSYSYIIYLSYYHSC